MDALQAASHRRLAWHLTQVMILIRFTLRTSRNRELHRLIFSLVLLYVEHLSSLLLSEELALLLDDLVDSLQGRCSIFLLRMSIFCN